MSDKRYAIVCAACDLLAQASRSDATTCSPRCRVNLHRHPELRARWHLTGFTDDIPLAFLLQVTAYLRLFPQRRDELRDGTLDLEHPTRRDVISDEAREDAARALDQLATQIASTLDDTTETLPAWRLPAGRFGSQVPRARGDAP